MTRHLVLACLIAAWATPSFAQSWEYKSYKKSGQGGQYDRTRFVAGTISLEEKDGKAFFRMVAGEVDACLRGEIPALVTRDETTLTIEPQFAIAGCERIRYVIRTDGSGGVREHLRGERWVNDKFDHGLTPKP